MSDKEIKKITTAVSEEEIAMQYEYMQLVLQMNKDKARIPTKQYKYFLMSFGCQMNENDSEKLAGILAKMGYTETAVVEESDLILYNTCCVRENAELKVYGHLGALKELKKERPELIIGVCGCMVQQPQIVEHIRKKFKQVDIIFGTHNLHQFPEILFHSMKSNERVIEILESTGFIAEDMPIERKDKVKAWVTVMYGCNNFCSYCIVPYVRGRERSRNKDEIIREVMTLGRNGYKEITLLGQNVNSYGLDSRDHTSFSTLLKELNEIEGIERIRFMTSHPKDLSNDLIKAIGQLDKVCEALHLPIQSGSTRILQAMNRKYTKENYLALVDRIREGIPGIAISTDIIVGYPGETEEDFLETLDLIEKVKFDNVYTFIYSKRTGTPAASLGEQVSEEIKKKRFKQLALLQNKIGIEYNKTLLHEVFEVLVEGLSKNNDEMLTGRTRTNKIVHFKGSADLIGKLVHVKIDHIHTWSLEGILI